MVKELGRGTKQSFCRGWAANKNLQITMNASVIVIYLLCNCEIMRYFHFHNPLIPRKYYIRHSKKNLKGNCKEIGSVYYKQWFNESRSSTYSICLKHDFAHY